jgi:transcriptional regulator GlxA family with amidase domain
MMPARETERMMKLQDVILKAMAKKLTWIQAAEIAGMSVRHMQRKRQAYIEYGYTGLSDRRRGNIPGKRPRTGMMVSLISPVVG